MTERDQNNFDDQLKSLFAPVRPRDDFEESIIAKLRERPARRFALPSWKIHPAVRATAAAVAASIVIAAVGYVASERMSSEPQKFGLASHYLRDAEGKSGTAEKWDFGGGANSALIWSAWNDRAAERNLSYSYKNPYASTESTTAGFKLNQSINGEFWTSADAAPQRTFKSGIADNANNHDEDKQNVLYGDGRVTFEKNPFTGVQRDNIFSGKSEEYKLPALREEQSKHVAAERGIRESLQNASVDLDRVLPEINFPGTPLSDAIDFLRDVTQANIIVNWKALEVAGVSRATPVSAHLKNVKLSKALNSVLDTLSGATGAKIVYTNDGDVISVSTQRDVGLNDVVTRVYDIHDLHMNVPNFEGPSGNSSTTQPGRESADQLMKLMRETVNSDSWKENGGELGSIHEADGKLVVTQTADNQEAIARLISQVRDAREPTSQPTPFAGAQSSATESRSIIRTGTIELDVDSFDATFNSIKQIATDLGGYIGTINSEKLPNGKVRGTLTLRVPPEKTDELVTKLRPLGEVRRQNLAAEEVTKQLADLARQLDTATSMHQHLTDLANGKNGEVKDKVAAQHDAGEWQQKAQEAQSQIATLKNQVLLSTITVVLAEKGIDAPAAIHESETENLNVETSNVEKSRADVTQIVNDAHGRIIQSELHQLDAGQVSARVVAEVAPDRASDVIEKLKAIGNVTRLEAQRQSNGTSGLKSAADVHVERDDTQLVISLYNLASILPRTTSTVNLACEDIEQTYRALVDRVAKSSGKLVSSNINRQQDNGTATVQFELKTEDADAFISDLKALGELMKIESSQASDSSSVTATKRGFVVQISSIASVLPRQVITRALAASDVAHAYNAILDAARKANARIVTSKLEEQSSQPTTGYLDFEIRRSEISSIENAIAGAGDIVNGNVVVSSDSQNTLESKVQYKLSLGGVDQVPPREMNMLAIESKQVESDAGEIVKLAQESGGRVLASSVARETSGQTIAHLVLDVPLARVDEVIDRAQSFGTVRASQDSKNAQVLPGKLSRARIDLTLASPDAIVQANAGVFATIKSALTTSAAGLMWSLRMIVIGLCLLAPWALIAWGGWKFIRRSRRTTPAG